MESCGHSLWWQCGRSHFTRDCGALAAENNRTNQLSRELKWPRLFLVIVSGRLPRWKVTKRTAGRQSSPTKAHHDIRLGRQVESHPNPTARPIAAALSNEAIEIEVMKNLGNYTRLSNSRRTSSARCPSQRESNQACDICEKRRTSYTPCNDDGRV